MSLRCRLLPPGSGLRVVLAHALTLAVHLAVPAQRRCIALAGGPAAPFQGLAPVLLHCVADRVAEAGLRPPMLRQSARHYKSEQ